MKNIQKMPKLVLKKSSSGPEPNNIFNAAGVNLKKRALDFDIF